MIERNGDNIKLQIKRNVIQDNEVVPIVVIDDVPITTRSIRKFNLMKEDYILLEFSLSEAVGIAIGDFIDDPLFGRFFITEEQMPKFSHASGGYDYSLRFDADYMVWKNWQHCLVVSLEGATQRMESEWGLTDRLEVHAQQVADEVNLINALSGSDKYVVWVHYTASKQSEVHYLSYSGINIIESLNTIAEQWSCEWWVTHDIEYEIDGVAYTNVIHFGKMSYGDEPVEFILGENVEKMDVTKDQSIYATRLYAYGGTQNIPEDYDKKLVFTVNLVDKGLYCDTIRPLSLDMISGESKVTTYAFYLGQDGVNAKTVGLDLAEGTYTLNGLFRSELVSRRYGQIKTLTASLGIMVDNDQSTYRSISNIEVDGIDGIDTFGSKRTWNASFDVTAAALEQTSLGGKMVTISDGQLILAARTTMAFTFRWSDSAGGGTAKSVPNITAKSSDATASKSFAVVINGEEHNATLNPFHSTDYDERRMITISSPPSGFGIGSKFTIPERFLTLDVPIYYYSPIYETGTLSKVGEKKLHLPLDKYPNRYMQNAQPPVDAQVVELVVLFPDEYPKMSLKISEVEYEEKQEEVTHQDGITSMETWLQYKFRCTKTDGSEFMFLTKYMLEGKLEAHFVAPTTSQSSGHKLSGMTFEVGFDDNSQVFTVIRNSNYGTNLPNEWLMPSVGDEFFLTGWNPKAINEPGMDLVSDSEERLALKAKAYLDAIEDGQFAFMCTMMSDTFFDADEYTLFPAGQNVKVYHDSLSQGYKESRIIGFEYKLDKPYDSPQYTVGETEAYSRLKQIEKQLKSGGADVASIDGRLIALEQGQSSGAGVSESAMRELIIVEGGRRFLSKRDDDTAQGKITFNAGTDTKTGAYYTDERGFMPGWIGYGARIGTDEAGRTGVAEFEEVNVRGAIRAAELVFNRIRAEEGEAIRSIGHGEILTVDEENMTATLKLEGDEWATIDVGDICRGLYNTIGKDYTTDDEGEDDNGFRKTKGFFASYFYVAEMLVNERGRCEFRYGLQDGTSEHPCPLMKFAAYGNFDSTKKERQSSMYITAVGIAPRVLFLAGVNDWKIKPYNIKVAIGNINDLQVYEKTGENEYELKTLDGDAGFYVEDNIYLGGVIQQFIAASMDDIMESLGMNYNAELLRGSDNIIVDALGNIVDGIYTEYTDGQNINRRYKLHTGVTVYDTAKKKYLTAKSPDDDTELGEDEFNIYCTCDGCEVLRDGADFYITSIANTNDGISETVLTDEQLRRMRMTNECRLNFFIVTANGWRTQMTYPVKITHLNEAYITFQLDNDFDSMSYRTQLESYAGLPISTRITASRNAANIDVVSVTVKNDIIGTVTVDSGQQQVAFGSSGLVCNLTSDGLFTISHGGGAETDLPDLKHQFEISCVAKYAGVLYESGKRVFTVQETTDATLYKLLLSANAISQDGGSYTPSSVDVKLQVVSDSGTSVWTESEVNGGSVGNVRIRYINGTYDPNGTNQFLDQCPAFTDVATCFTVLAIEGNNVLDVQSVTINARGHDGAGQAYVETNIDQIVIDCNASGNIEQGVVSPVTLRASLYWGTSKCVLDRTSCYFSYGNLQSLPNVDTTTNEASKDYTFSVGDTLVSSRITIFLSGHEANDATATHTAQKTIAVVANRRGNDGIGQNGQTAFTSFAFKRSAASLLNEAPRGGSYDSPYPSTPSGWEDIIPIGDAPIWMVSVVFTSDGEYPQPAKVNGLVPWGAPRLLSDSYGTDYELSSVETNPGTPETAPANWHDPRETGIDWSTMVWMATRNRIVTSSGAPDWDDWVVLRIKGEKGDAGTALQSITTWYLLSAQSDGVVPPVNPSSSGWTNSYSMPTEDLPFLWRFTRYIYADEQSQQVVVDTPCELIARYAAQPNFNILDSTSFLAGNMDGWNKYRYNSANPSPWNTSEGTMYYSMIVNDDANSGFDFGVDDVQKHKGRNSYKVSAIGSQSMGDNAYVQILRQTIFNEGVVQKVETGKWYTLSFWHKGAAICSYTMALDADVNTYKDGVQKHALYQEEWPASEDWSFHTLTFKTVGSYPDYGLDIRWRMYLTQSRQTASICMPKLEVGQMATEYLASVEEQNPMPLRTVWKEGEQYYQGAQGERYFHLVNHNKMWYRCILSHISTQSNKPNPANDTIYWKRATSIPFLASGLLLADEGVIDLLYSNKIYTYNDKGQKTASINADQNGSYCIYYPASGNKMMEFCADGFIHYYNDDESNSPQWRLGHGGDVTKSSSDDWVPIGLTLLPDGLTTAYAADEDFAADREQYYQFFSGSSGQWSQYNQMIYKGKNDPPNPSTAILIDNGYYTPNKQPWPKIDEDGSDMKYSVIIYHIVNGKIDATWERTLYKGNYNNEQDS